MKLFNVELETVRAVAVLAGLAAVVVAVVTISQRRWDDGAISRQHQRAVEGREAVLEVALKGLASGSGAEPSPSFRLDVERLLNGEFDPAAFDRWTLSEADRSNLTEWQGRYQRARDLELSLRTRHYKDQWSTPSQWWYGREAIQLVVQPVLPSGRIASYPRPAYRQ